VLSRAVHVPDPAGPIQSHDSRIQPVEQLFSLG
jgi:hypothetical protein